MVCAEVREFTGHFNFPKQKHVHPYQQQYQREPKTQKKEENDHLTCLPQKL